MNEEFCLRKDQEKHTRFMLGGALRHLRLGSENVVDI